MASLNWLNYFFPLKFKVSLTTNQYFSKTTNPFNDVIASLATLYWWRHQFNRVSFFRKRFSFVCELESKGRDRDQNDVISIFLIQEWDGLRSVINDVTRILIFFSTPLSLRCLIFTWSTFTLTKLYTCVYCEAFWN